MHFRELETQFREVEIKWCPGHANIEGNERADKLAKAGQHADQDPRAEITAAGLKALAKKMLSETRSKLWTEACRTLNERYLSWGLTWSTDKCPEALEVLRRPQLHRYGAVRHGHGDFSWYHRKFHHEDANVHCSCGQRKEPLHIVHCRRVLARWRDWPWPYDEKVQPKRRLRSTAERHDYLVQIMRRPKLFAEFLEATQFYKEICPR